MKVSPLVIAAVVVAGHIGFLATIIGGRAAILREGREITLPVEPVDPRDLMRGDYVRLAYPISRLPANLLQNPPAEGVRLGEVTVRVEIAPAGAVRPVAIYRDTPPEAPTGEQLDLAGRSETSWTSGLSEIAVTYGIERYYVPEGEGLQIERDLGVRPFNVRLAVGQAGQMQIKALYDGETRLYEEPLY